jgi:hypothetical protein
LKNEVWNFSLPFMLKNVEVKNMQTKKYVSCPVKVGEHRNKHQCIHKKESSFVAGGLTKETHKILLALTREQLLEVLKIMDIQLAFPKVADNKDIITVLNTVGKKEDIEKALNAMRLL